MNILIVTNTFTPHVGGVARSVEAFAGEYRRRGHQVLVLAPEYPDMPVDEVDVIRIPGHPELQCQRLLRRPATASGPG
jgi:1,2-diacylglycerol 3-alpha-glucosyltransferase